MLYCNFLLMPGLGIEPRCPYGPGILSPRRPHIPEPLSAANQDNKRTFPHPIASLSAGESQWFDYSLTTVRLLVLLQQRLEAGVCPKDYPPRQVTSDLREVGSPCNRGSQELDSQT